MFKIYIFIRSEANRTKIMSQNQPMVSVAQNQPDDMSQFQPMDVTVDQPSAISNNNSKILRLILNSKLVANGNEKYTNSNTSASRSSPFDIEKLINTTPSPITATQVWPQATSQPEPSLIASTEPVSCHGNSFTTSFNTHQSSAFMPLNSSASITNGQIICYDRQQVDNHDSNSLMSDISFAMDMSVSHSDSYDLDNLSIYTTAQPTVISPHSPLSASHNSFISHNEHSKPVKQEFFTPDEDSLTGMLNIDLMDVNSVMTFLDQDHVTPVTSDSSTILPSQ